MQMEQPLLIPACCLVMLYICAMFHEIDLFHIRDIPEDHNTLRERDIRFNRK